MLHSTAQGLHSAAQGLHLAAQGLHMAAQGLQMHHIAVYAVYGWSRIPRTPKVEGKLGGLVALTSYPLSVTAGLLPLICSCWTAGTPIADSKDRKLESG